MQAESLRSSGDEKMDQIQEIKEVVRGYPLQNNNLNTISRIANFVCSKSGS
jgi:hypothetical protein